MLRFTLVESASSVRVSQDSEHSYPRFHSPAFCSVHAWYAVQCATTTVSSSAKLCCFDQVQISRSAVARFTNRQPASTEWPASTDDDTIGA